jgi:hypothetical protein
MLSRPLPAPAAAGRATGAARGGAAAMADALQKVARGTPCAPTAAMRCDAMRCDVSDAGEWRGAMRCGLRDRKRSGWGEARREALLAQRVARREQPRHGRASRAAGWPGLARACRPRGSSRACRHRAGATAAAQAATLDVRCEINSGCCACPCSCCCCSARAGEVTGAAPFPRRASFLCGPACEVRCWLAARRRADASACTWSPWRAWRAWLAGSTQAACL